MPVKSVALLLACITPLPALADPAFVTRSSDLGLRHQYTGGKEHFIGGGVATFDCNGDLYPDLFVAGGESTAILLRNSTGQRGGDLMLREDTPEILRLNGVIGAYPIDIDSDGHLDLVVLRAGKNHIFRGLPNCRFSEFPATLGFESGDRWSTAFSATWEPRETLPTLAIGNYVDRTDPDGPFGTCDVRICSMLRCALAGNQPSV